MPRLRVLVVLALAACTLMSAISVIYVKHESRIRFVELESLRRERDELNSQWTRLQLEYSAWATHARIERVAAERLDLTAPAVSSIVLVNPPTSSGVDAAKNDQRVDGGIDRLVDQVVER